MRPRFLPVLVSVFLVLGFFPLEAFAEQSEYSDIQDSTLEALQEGDLSDSNEGESGIADETGSGTDESQLDNDARGSVVPGEESSEENLPPASASVVDSAPAPAHDELCVLSSGSYYLVPTADDDYSLDSSLSFCEKNLPNENEWEIDFSDSEKWATICSVDKGGYLSVRDGSLCLLPSASDNDSRWYFVRAEENGYGLVNAGSRLALGVSSNIFSQGKKAYLGEWDGKVEQIWDVADPVESGADPAAQIRSSDQLIQENSEIIISSALDATKVLDVYGGSSANEANVQIYDSNMTPGQRWRVSYDEKGYATFTNVGSGKVLDVYSASASSGANVQQYSSNGGRGQKWIVQGNDDGTVTILSALAPGLALDVSGASPANEANVQIYSSNGGRNQKWKIVTEDDFYSALDDAAMSSGEVLENGGEYLLSSALDATKVLDVYGGSSANEANVQIYDSNMTPGQRWRVSYDEKGYATFTNVGSGKVLDVYSASASSGANVQQYSSNGGRGQKWIVQGNDDGTVTILSALAPGLALDVSGASPANEANVQIYSSNGGRNQKWNAIEAYPSVEPCRDFGLEGRYYEIVPSANADFAIDVENMSQSNGANIELYERNSTLAQLFYFEFFEDNSGSGYYMIINARSGKALDVADGNLVPTTNIQQWTPDRDNGNQLFSIVDRGNGVVSFVNKATGLCIDIYGERMANGTNIQAYSTGSLASQGFVLEEKTNLLEEGVFSISMASSQDKVIDVYGGSKNEGANVQLYSKNKSFGQKWEVRLIGDNTYSLQSLSSGRYLTCDANGNVSQRALKTDGSQSWVPSIIGGGISLCNVKSGLALDVVGGSTKNGTNVEVYEPNGSNAQVFLFFTSPIVSDGVYKIHNAANSSLSVDVYGCSNKSGANVQLYRNNDSVAQVWNITQRSDGTFSIVNSYSGMALDVYGGTAKNGANVQQYKSNGSIAQKWKIVYNSDGTFRLAFAGDDRYVLTASGSASSGSNLVISKYTGSSNQKYTFEETVYTPPMPADQQAMLNKIKNYWSGTRYLIAVNRSTHKVGVFSGSKGNWTLKYYWSCVTGAPGSPTITGNYYTTGFKRTTLTTDSRARWATQIHGGYFFHSILASDNELGKSLSHGCIRLSVSNAKWIYNNISSNTRVVIYG